MGDKVVVTGMGVVSPLGLDVPSTWQGLVSGRSGIDYITLFDPEPLESKIAAEVKNFDPAQYLDRKSGRRMDRFAQFACVAALQAVEQARLSIDASNANDIGVVIGAGFGGLGTLLEQHRVLMGKGPSRVSPFLVPMMIADMAPGEVSILTGAKGPNFCTTSACASGSDAIGVSLEIIKRGDAQAMIAGGSEATIVPLSVAGFCSARALSTKNHEPEKASCPFDAERDGFVNADVKASYGLSVSLLGRSPLTRVSSCPVLSCPSGDTGFKVKTRSIAPMICVIYYCYQSD